MRIHDLKIQRKHFVDVESGQKKAEIRKHDRDFNVGDFLQLNEIDEHGTATGEGLRVRVTHILPGGEYGLDADYSILSIERIARTKVWEYQPEPLVGSVVLGFDPARPGSDHTDRIVKKARHPDAELCTVCCGYGYTESGYICEGCDGSGRDEVAK